MLIRVYLFVCHRYRDEGLCALAQRQSNNATPAFTDEEVLTIYLFGFIRKGIADYRIQGGSRLSSG